MGFIFNLFSGNKRIMFLLFCYVSGLLGLVEVYDQAREYGYYVQATVNITSTNLPRNVGVSR